MIPVHFSLPSQREGVDQINTGSDAIRLEGSRVFIRSLVPKDFVKYHPLFWF